MATPADSALHHFRASSARSALHAEEENAKPDGQRETRNTAHGHPRHVAIAMANAQAIKLPHTEANRG
jgi:hypothetical protein